MGRYFDYDGVTFEGSAVDEEDRSDLEKMFFDFVTQFEVFWGAEPTFDRTNTNEMIVPKIPQPPLDDACLERIIRFAVEECFS